MRTFSTFTLLILAVTLFGQGTPGTVNVSVTTKPNGLAFSPRHVLAIWIEDDAGNFVKTLKLNASERKKYLYTWNAKSGGNTTDATTGSTLGTHTTHSVSWDCLNTSGTVAEDGNYAVKIEYTSEHAQGPMASISFTKEGDVFAFQPTDLTYFIDMDLVYTPSQSTGFNSSYISYDLSTYPNPVRDRVRISLLNHIERNTSIRIYQSDMKLINVLWDGVLSAGDHEFTWNLHAADGSKVTPGTYFLLVEGDNLLSTRQIVVQ